MPKLDTLSPQCSDKGKNEGVALKNLNRIEEAGVKANPRAKNKGKETFQHYSKKTTMKTYEADSLV